MTGWRVVSKLPAVPGGTDDVGAWARQCVRTSLGRLRIPRLYGLLVHRLEDLAGPHGAALCQAAAELRGSGVIEKFGVSIYDPAELDAVWPRFPLDLVQAPFNVFDRRLAATGWLSRLHDAGIEVHSRSAFLQGLLLMEPDRRPAFFLRWQPLLEQWDRWLAAERVSAVRACLGFVWAHPEIARVVVGVDSLGHLREVLDAVADVAGTVPPAQAAAGDLDLITPSRWVLQ